MNTIEKKLGTELQNALADFRKFNRLVGTMTARGAHGAARKAVEKRDAAWSDVVRLRKRLWALG